MIIMNTCTVVILVLIEKGRYTGMNAGDRLRQNCI